MLNGILSIITDPDNLHGKILRKHFVFKIIPLLNPDGVYRGCFRHDTRGNNLNRFYDEPRHDHHPTIFAAKKVILQQKEIGKLAIYIDLHAHASRRGCFMFGNALPLDNQKLQNMLLPKVISLNSIDFDYNQCSFSQSNMKVKDKHSGLSREGSGRVAIWKETSIANSYTLECHYSIGVNKNELTQFMNSKTGRLSELEEEDKELLLAGTGKEHPYTQESFENVGKAVCYGILDFYSINPVSRIPTTEYKTIDNLKEELRKQIEEQKTKKASYINNTYNRLYNGGCRTK